MQTTLLGLAFAVILALLAALLAPFFVDWTQFRPVFEAEASRMLGAPVHVAGAIDARILPSPSLTLHDLTIGKADDPHALHARRLDVEFALGPLLRGQFRADEAHLIGPEFTLGLGEAGALVAPGLTASVDPDKLSIERLSIEDGRAHLVDAASGTRVTLDKFWFNGDLRSLAGPLKGEGAFVAGGELYGYRVSTGRLGDDGGLRIHVSLDPSDQPFTADADGTMLLTQGKPHFQGKVMLSRPAGLVTASGRSSVEPPWRVTSEVDADPDDVKFDRIDYLYGSQDKGLHLTGTAGLQLGSHPLLHAVLSAQQADLDQLIATPDKPTRLPADALRTLIGKFVGTWAPPIPVALSLSADTITLGGQSVMLFDADTHLDNKAWTLDRVEFRAPGLTQVGLSGRLALQPELAFTGPVRLETNDANALVSWIDGHKGAAKRTPFKMRGDAVLSETKFSLSHLQAEIDHKAVQGDLHYAAAGNGQPSRLDAKLSAPELDVDSMTAFFDAARGGGTTPLPDEIALGIDIGRAKIAGIEAQTIHARLKRTAKLLQIEQLSVADLGGAQVHAAGRVDTAGAAPRGTLSLDVEARDLDGVIALADEYAPQASAPLRRAAALNPRAVLHASVALDGPAKPEKGAKTDARISVEGQVGGLRASLHVEARRDSTEAAAHGLLAAFGTGDVRLDAQVDGDDGAALATLLGLDKIVAVPRQPGFVNVLATGDPQKTMQLQGRLVAGDFDARATGTLNMADTQGPTAALQLDIAKADLRPLAGAQNTEPLALSLHGRLALSERAAALSDMKAALAGSNIYGALTLGFGVPLHIAGHIDADTVDAAAAIAAAIGVPRSSGRTKRPIDWSAEPYRAGRFGELKGRVTLNISRASLTPSLVARQVTAAIVFDGSEIALDKFAAKIGSGDLSGRLSFRHGGKGLAARAKVEAKNLDAASILPDAVQPVLDGRLSAKLDIEATGLSPRALVGSLAGSGSITLDDGSFSDLDPDTFATIIRASDKGLAVDTPRVHDLVVAALDRGRLQVPRIETALSINGGQIRAANANAEATGAKLAATGNLDLLQQQIDLRLTLSGPTDSDHAAGRPDIFIALKGPWSLPQRTVDVSALAGWLTIRRIDREAKRLEALEAAREKTAAEAARAKTLADRPDPAAAASSGQAVKPKPGEPPTAKSPPGNAQSTPPARSAPAPSRGNGSQSAQAKKPVQLAPPLPQPAEIPPRPSPALQRGSALDVPNGVPLWLPSAEPSVMDSLVGAPHQR